VHDAEQPKGLLKPGGKYQQVDETSPERKKYQHFGDVLDSPAIKASASLMHV